MIPVNAATLRILDANANRAREALRVIEDYARFALDDGDLSAKLKQLRHDFAAATSGFVADAILHRDTPGDVGTANKTSTETNRADIAHVVTAAAKRLGETLRTIEEYLKTIDPARAAQVESLRYRFYDIEQSIAFTLRPLACAFATKVRLYLLITESLCKRPWLQVAEQAISGGAECLQLREKELNGAEFFARARQLVALCRKHNVLCVINDRADIALLADADGVHLDQTDLPAREARKLIGANKILGVSTHNLDQAKQAVKHGADYLGVGPFFKSTTKTRDFIAGPDYARQVAQAISIPAVAIAGINEQNVDEVLATGIKTVAVSSAICSADDPQAAAARLKAKLKD